MSLLTTNIRILREGYRTRVQLLDMHKQEKERILDADFDSMSDGFDLYHRGYLIQDAFPFLTNSEREFILTGLTDEEWNEMFKDVEGDVA